MALSPRTAYSRKLDADAELLTNLTMNINPSTIKSLKTEFQSLGGVFNREEFIIILRNELKHWKPSLPNRDTVIVKLLHQLFNDIDLNGNGQLDWEEFTNYIIEKGVVNGSERNNRVDSIKRYSINRKWPQYSSDSSIEHLVNMESLDRFAIIESYSSEVKFFHHETGQPFGRDLIVQKHSGFDLLKPPERVLVNNGLFLSSKNLLLVSCNDGTIRPYENNNVSFYPALPDSGYPVMETEHTQRTLEWDHVNDMLYTGEHSGQINLWKLQEKKPVKRLANFHSGMVTDLEAVPRLEFLFSSSQDRHIILWDMITARPHRCYTGHKKGILSLSFNPEYRLLFSAGFDHDIFVWNPYIESLAFKIEGHNASLVCVEALEDNNQIVSADIDGWVKVWDIRNCSCVYSVNIEDKKPNNRLDITDFIHLKRQQRLIVGGQKLVTLDYDKNSNPSLIDDHPPISTQFSPYNSKLFTTVSNKVKVWNAFTGRAEHIYAISGNNEISFATLDGWSRRILVGTVNGRTTVYNVQNGALMKQLHPHKSEVNFIGTSKELKLIVTASLDMTMVVHSDKELNDTAVLKVYTDLGAIVTALQILETEVIITGNSEGIIQTWSLESRQPEPTVMHHTGEVTNIVKLPEDALIISSDTTGELALWGTGKSVYKFSAVVVWTNGHEGAVNWMSYFNGILYTGDDKGFVKAANLTRVLELVRSEQSASKITGLSQNEAKLSIISPELVEYFYSVKVHSEPIKHLSLILDPLTIISTGFDKKVRLLEAQTGKCVGALQQGTDRKVLREENIAWDLNIDVQRLDTHQEQEIVHLCKAVFKKERLKLRKSQTVRGLESKTLLTKTTRLNAVQSQAQVKHHREQCKSTRLDSLKKKATMRKSREVLPPLASYLQQVHVKVSKQAAGYAALLASALSKYT